MPARKRIRPGDQIELELGSSDRAVIMQLRDLDAALAQRILDAPKSRRRVAFTSGELDRLIDHLAAEIEREECSAQREKLLRLLVKIDRVRSRYVIDVQPLGPAERPVEQSAPVAELTQWADNLLAHARQAGVPTDRPICKVVLSQAQRRTIIELEVDDELRGLLTVAATGPRTFKLTVEQMIAICRAIAAPLPDAHGKYRNLLLKVAEKAARAMNDVLTGQARTPPQGGRITAYQLLISLKNVQPTVWRRFQVDNCSLAQLHSVLQIVMGWENRHHHYFAVAGKTFSDVPLADRRERGDVRQARLSQLVEKGYRRFHYIYDIGDSWEHVIQIESAFEPERHATFPYCLEGRGSCPPEDVGGPEGYAEFLEVINDFSDPEQKDYLDWCGGWFDPDAFDIELVNRVLSMAAQR